MREEIMIIADEISNKRYGKDFDKLDVDIQYKIFIDAEMQYNDEVSGRADMLRDNIQDGELR